jgi:hypothetical protein
VCPDCAGASDVSGAPEIHFPDLRPSRFRHPDSDIPIPCIADERRRDVAGIWKIGFVMFGHRVDARIDHCIDQG